MISLFGLDPARFEPHALHAGDRSYLETNYYTDVLIELVAAAGHEPLAMLGCTLEIDFEGDQWTFFKPDADSLRRMYGIDVHEMQPYRALPEQIAGQLELGRTVLVELDAWFLPDTGPGYRSEHAKTSVIAAGIDVAGQRLRYFHSTGLYELAGADFRGIFRLDGTRAEMLPPYCDLVRFGVGRALYGDELREAARDQLARHLLRRPATNPIRRFADRLAADLPGLLDASPADYHCLAFANVRMAGAGFELAASHVRWLGGPERAASALTEIVAATRSLSFCLARRRPFDVHETLAGAAAAWDRATSALDSVLEMTG